MNDPLFGADYETRYPKNTKLKIGINARKNKHEYFLYFHYVYI